LRGYPLEEALDNASENVRMTARNVAATIKVGMGA
jgi:glycerate kinase